jgi:hypothetical protein
MPELKIKHNITSSKFIIPDEQQFLGSSSLFAHLHARLLERYL